MIGSPTCTDSMPCCMASMLPRTSAAVTSTVSSPSSRAASARRRRRGPISRPSIFDDATDSARRRRRASASVSTRLKARTLNSVQGALCICDVCGNLAVKRRCAGRERVGQVGLVLTAPGVSAGWGRKVAQPALADNPCHCLPIVRVILQAELAKAKVKEGGVHPQLLPVPSWWSHGGRGVRQAVRNTGQPTAMRW